MRAPSGATDEVALRGRLGPAARRVARTVQGVVVTLAGVAGVLVLLAALAPLAGLQLVRLATGSMSPGYPAGSVLLVQDVAAGEVVPGDVVTVMRADGSPVTHRVVEVEPVRGGARLVLRGDANEQVDPAPYLATRVGRVIGGIPVGGGVFDLARSPFAVPLLGAAASLIVLWAWWPARRVPAHRMRAAARLAESRGGVR